MRASIKEVFVGLGMILSALTCIICSAAFMFTGEPFLAHIAGATFVTVLILMVWVIV